MDVLGITQKNFSEELAAGKDRDEAFDHARIFYEVMQKRFISAFEQAFEVDQRTLRVRSGGEGGLEVRFDDWEGVAEDGGDVV